MQSDGSVGALDGRAATFLKVLKRGKRESTNVNAGKEAAKWLANSVTRATHDFWPGYIDAGISGQLCFCCQQRLFPDDKCGWRRASFRANAPFEVAAWWFVKPF